tara:strand:+ start:30 stop:866 length:837 start_codon:yes stop_codon:yes gene_type:complete
MIIESFYVASIGANVFYGICIVFMIYHMSKGWSDGFGRKIFSLIAIIAGYLGAYYIGPTLVPILQDQLDWNLSLLRSISSLSCGILSYFFIKVLSLFLTKRTRDHEGLSKTISGLGGASLGIGVGCIWILIFLSGIKFLNSLMNQNPLENQENPPGLIGKTFHHLNNLVEDSSVKQIYKKIDLVPDSVYRLSAKSANILRDSESRDQLIQSHEFKQLIQDPLLKNFSKNPDIFPLIQNKNYSQIATHPETLKLIKNPEFLKLIDKYSLESAMDRSLRK